MIIFSDNFITLIKNGTGWNKKINDVYDCELINGIIFIFRKYSQNNITINTFNVAAEAESSVKTQLNLSTVVNLKN